jgi:chromosome segregation ATPase
LPAESTLTTETQERERVSQVCWQRLTESEEEQAPTRDNYKTNFRDYQKVKGKHKNLTNRNQDHSSSPNTPEKLDSDLKAYLMMMEEDINKDFNNSLKEIQENTAKELEVHKEKQESTTKQVMELNKTIQDLKREVETIKKTQSETTLKIETLGKKSGTIDVSISKRIQEMEERISGAEDSVENMGTTIKENAKCKKILIQNIQEI